MESLYSVEPAEQIYKAYTPGKYIGYKVEKYFADRFTYFTEEEWIGLILAGNITVNGKSIEPGETLKEHDHIVTRMGVREEPPANRKLEIIFENDDLRVFNKAAPIPVHPCGRYFKNSMTELLKDIYPQEIPRPVQRLDALTTGVIVFAKTKTAAAHLTEEFSQNRVDKQYLALVEGRPDKNRFTVEAPIGKVKGSARGTGSHTINPKDAVTEFEWLSERGERSLLKAVPFTGRTNQIRVHLADCGLPLVNDPVYGKPADPPLQFGLHSYRMRLNCLGTDLELKAPWPDHFQPFIDAAESSKLL